MNKCLRIITLMIALVLPQISMAKTGASEVNAQTKALNTAAETGDKVQFKKILKQKGLDLNLQDEEGMTPLMSAALGGQVELLKQLLQKKVNLEVKNSAGDTALAVAVTNDQIAAAKVLIEAGANVDLVVAGDEEDTLLIRAATGNLQLVKLILNKKKDLVNKTNKLGETALMQSVRFGNNDSVKLLLASGADTKIKSKYGLSALDIAKQSNNQTAVQLLSGK